MGKFRLAIFNTQPPHLYVGGVERRIIETTKRIQSQADIAVYSGAKAGFKKPTTIDGVGFMPLYSTDKIFPLDNWFFNRSIAKKANTFEADIFEAHAVSGYGLIKELKKQSIKKPFIHTIHGVLADEYEQAKKNGFQSLRDRFANYFMGRLAKQESETAKNATLIVTISNYSLEKIKQFYEVNETKVRIVPNGVDVEKFKPFTDIEATKHQFGIGNDPCVLFVGSLIPRKGIPFLVEAAKKIVREKSDTKFLIVGEGPLRKQLDNSLEATKLSGNFKFLGNLKDDKLPAIYNCADVFALPSIQEGQGIVLLEAQACAKPIVAFNIGGVNEAVCNGETGLLVKLGNTDEFADAILKLISEKNLQDKMGIAGRKFVLENFTWDICAQKMLNVYNEVLGRGNIH